MSYPYVIAEVGQNHNGSLELARELIRMCADPRPQDAQPALEKESFRPSAVKFTKRYLSEELTREAMEAPYDSPNSFGRTYGQHRHALEFSWEQLAYLSAEAQQMALDFGLTVCHPALVPPAGGLPHLSFLKVASRDIRNVPLLEALAELEDVKLIVSLGMADAQDLDRVLNILPHKHLTVMHCRSLYPTPPRLWDLQVIPFLRHDVPAPVRVGYSDHSLGIVAPVAAVAMGAEVIEKHVTLDRRMKGTDHLGSVDRSGLWRMCRDIHHVSEGLQGRMHVSAPPEVDATAAKLGRSLAWRSTLLPGTQVELRHLTMLSPGTGLGWEHRDRILGREVRGQVEGGSLVRLDQVRQDSSH